MTLEGLKKAIDALLADDPTRADEPIVLEVPSYTNDGLYQMTGITLVVESDVWNPGTVVATVAELEDDTS